MNTTVAPPAVKLFPLASLVLKVKVTWLPEATVEEETDTVEVATETAPGVTVIVGEVEVTADPLIVARTLVAVPAPTDAKVAV